MPNPVLEVLLRMKDEITAPLRSSERGLKGFAISLGDVAKGLAALGVGAALSKFFKGAVEESLDAAKSLDFLRQSINNAGEAFGSWEPKIDRSIDGLVKITKYGDDDFRKAMTNMVAKSGDVQGSFNNLGLAADVAAKKGIGLAEAGDLVGKGMAGNNRVFKDFGITSGTVAEKLEQLREKTHGYAETELNTLGGRLAQGKTAFKEMQEQVGNMITGSEGVRDAAGTLAIAMANLAEWVAENRERGVEFVDSLFSTIKAVGDLLAPVWSLIVALKDGVEATIGWSNIFKGFQIALVMTGSFFGAMAAKGKEAIGLILEAVGWLASKAAPILDKFGLGLGAVADGMMATGRRMVKEGGKAYDEVIDQTKDKILLIATATKTGQKKVSEAHDLAADQRHQITDEELKRREAATKKSHENLAALEQAAFKGSVQLLSAQQREYQELVRTFQEKMRDMTKEDQVKAEALLKTSHANLLLKWAGFGEELVPKVKGLVLQIRDGMADISTAVEKTTDEVIEKARRWEILKEQAREIGHAVGEAADLVLSFADSLGISDEKMVGLVAGIGNLGDAVSKIASGDVLGGLKQGVSEIAGVVGSLFGKSAQEKAVEAALNKNRQSLDRLTEEVGNLNINLTGQQLSGVEGALKEFFDKGGARNAGWGDQLADALKARGLSVTDLDSAAKELGIDIRPGGHLDPDTLRQLMEAIGATEATQFGNDFQGRRDQIQAGVALGTIGDEGAATAELARQISPAFARAFAGLDFVNSSDPEKTRVGAVSAIQGLFSEMSSGRLATSDLGGLRGSEFLQLLQDLFGLFGGGEIAGALAGPATAQGVTTAGLSIPDVSIGVPVSALGATGVAPASLSGVGEQLDSIRDGVWAIVDEVRANGQRAGGVNVSIGSITSNGSAVAVIAEEVSAAMRDQYDFEDLSGGTS